MSAYRELSHCNVGTAAPPVPLSEARGLLPTDSSESCFPNTAFRATGDRSAMAWISWISESIFEVITSRYPDQPAYLTASWAHFASVVRKAFAAGGGSTSPVNAALNVTICP